MMNEIHLMQCDNDDERTQFMCSSHFDIRLFVRFATVVDVRRKILALVTTFE